MCKCLPEKEIAIESCIICCINQPEVVLMPCNHGGICMKCVEDLVRRPEFLCHLCRKPVSQIAKISNTNQTVNKIIGISKVK